MEAEYTIDRKLLADCTTETLRLAWDAGSRLDTMGFLDATQQARLEAIKRELFSRPTWVG